MQYADFSYYTDVFKGQIITSADDFDSLEVKARAYVDRITYGRAQAVCDTDAVKKAVCVACEVYQQQSARAGIAAENNDGYSVSYRTDKDFEQKALYGAVSLYLPAELLYQGVDI